MKIGATAVAHGRYFTFQLAGVAVPHDPFWEDLRLIDDLRPNPVPVPARTSAARQIRR